MIKSGDPIDWRAARRSSAREAILDAAWALVAEEGLGALSLRELAKRAGITPPTVYAYFDSKHAIYDAMFGRAAGDFEQHMTEPYDSDDPRAVLVAGVHRFIEFCTSDVPRYQLLFQRTIQGFEPTADMYAPAVRALAATRELLAQNGVVDPRHVDMWTALTTGLVDQQISNDPGGDRWTRLVDDCVAMFLDYCGAPVTRPKSRPTRKSPR